MSKLLRLFVVAGLIAAWMISGSVVAQSPNTYTSITVSDITSGAPVVGGFFTTHINVSISNSNGSSTAVQGVEVYIAFDPAVVNVVDHDSNPTNGTQVEIRTGFFNSVQTGINRVEPCPSPNGALNCVHVAVSQLTGGVTNGSGSIAAIRWIGLAPGSAGLRVLTPETILSDPNGTSVTLNNASAPTIVILGPGAITGTVTRQGRTAGNHANTNVIALSPGGAQIAGPVVTNGSGLFSSPLSVPSGGTYTVIASYPGYLSAQRSGVYVVGATVDIGPTQLRGGDVNSDNCINIFDLAIIASWFSKTSPPAPAAVDINDDGVINIFDMTISASNFMRCGPTTW